MRRSATPHPGATPTIPAAPPTSAHPGPAQADQTAQTAQPEPALTAPPVSTGRADRPDIADASVSDLVRRAYEQIGSLVRHEIDFAKAEMAGKAKRAATGAGLFGAAGVLALYASAVLVAAAVLALALVLPAWAAALIIGGGLLLLAGLAALVGRARLRAATPAVPEESVRQLRLDLDAVTTAAKSRSRG